ncbi:MAG TPA: AzlC family ABC transporter permease [Solirubrobacterales bacterium]|nr:AzlC family ABC transporter permease [Solirubrobacterales bacterium]
MSSEGQADPRSGEFERGLRVGIPYSFAALLLAVSFGVLAQPVMGKVAPIVMSMTVFAGSAQFAAVAVLSAGGGAAAAVAAGILLNLRYVPMGIAIAPSTRGGPLRRAAIGQALIDFSWAAASRGGGRFSVPYMLGVTMPSYPCWVLGTAIGVFAGEVIADPGDFGLDALFPAFFLCLLMEGELRWGRPALVAAIGSLIALVLIPFTPAGIPVIAATGAALIGLLDARELAQ